MNVIFISPHFPSHFYNFCERLKARGVTVLGIGDAPWELIGPDCQNSLCDYRYVHNLQDYEEVYHVVADYIFHYGRIDFVESENEYWLELDARIRSDFNIRSGPRLEEMPDMNHKSKMKAAYQRAGVPSAKWTLPATLEEAEEFARTTGYPVIVKPDKGVGASDTYKIHNETEMREFWEGKNPETIFIEEELVPGHVETFDGITDSRRNILFCASQVLPRSLMDAVNQDEDVVSYCQAPGDDLREAGKKLLQEFDTRNKFFHFEFFRLDEDKEGLGKKGGIVGLEVNMRAPGGRIPDKMNYAYDTDVYTIWADSLIHDRCFMNSEFRHYITHVGRKDSIAYVHTPEEIRARLGSAVIEDFEVNPVLAAEMGNHAFLLRAETPQERDEQVAYILKREENG
ncbi:MAG: carbamoylphosphate synthase large subunit [Lachnospiraceae bacterium]|nr:carbamoylphosphate synthase large subunit [Lachnospiraceae bacterium]